MWQVSWWHNISCRPGDAYTRQGTWSSPVDATAGHVFRDVIISAMASQITSLAIVYSTVCSGADQTQHQSSASLAFVRGNHRWPVNYPHKGPVTRKIFPFDDVIMQQQTTTWYNFHLLPTRRQQTYNYVNAALLTILILKVPFASCRPLYSGTNTLIP